MAGHGGQQSLTGRGAARPAVPGGVTGLRAPPDTIKRGSHAHRPGCLAQIGQTGVPDAGTIPLGSVVGTTTKHVQGMQSTTVGRPVE